ncbi:MAG: hypothetical protein KF869_00015 [Phycisphaeraceae bacterium]|nr:hypothetical protein [Phycisphaeraceae bacterium]
MLFASCATARGDNLGQCYTIQTMQGMMTFIVDGGQFDASGLAAGDCLKQAISDIPAGGTIKLRVGTGPFFIIRAPAAPSAEFDERTGLPIIEKPITIEFITNPDMSDPLSAVISTDTTGGNTPDYRLFLIRGDLGALTLKGVTLQNGRSLTPGQTNGGAIKHDSLQRLTLINCIVRDNLAGTRGGAIWSQNRVTCDNVRFIRNHANPAGLPGGNPESIRGGAIYHAPGKALPENEEILALTNCIFRCNSSTQEGGAIWLGGGYQRRIIDCQFYGNTAVQAGGAMTCNGTAFVNGVNPVRLEVIKCRFGRADVAGFGCGDEPAGAPSFGDAYGAGNSAGEDGGAVQLVDNAQPVFVRCTFENNRVNSMADGRGGAIYMSSIGGNASNARSAVFIESLFLRNQSFNGGAGGGDGGAVYIRESSSPYFLDCGFIENNSMRGGGMFLIGGCNPRMYNCVFSRNAVSGATSQGSGLWSSASSPQLLHCSLLTAIGSPLVWIDTGSSLPGMRIANSIVWGGGPGGTHRAFGGVPSSGSPLTSYPQIAYSDIDVDTPSHYGDSDEDPVGATNINCDPLVENAAINDVHLSECSPAIDRASRMLAVQRFEDLFADSFGTFGFSFFIVDLDELEHSGFDYDDPNAPPEGAFHNDATGPRPRTPRLPVVGGPPGCEADMGADESPYVIEADMALYCRQRGPGNPNSNNCAVVGTLVDSTDCSYCAGDDVFLQAQVQTDCPGQFVVRWYKCTLDPAECGMASGYALCSSMFGPDPNCGDLVFEEVLPVNGLSTYCIDNAMPTDSGCYCVYLVRANCGPAGPRKVAGCFQTNLGDETQACVGQLVRCVYVNVYPGPMVNIQPQPAQVCVGGRQQICATFDIPDNCEVPNIRWYYVAAPNCDTSNCPPANPMQGMYIDPANQSDGIEITFEPVAGQPGKYQSCLIFDPAMLAEHAGRYYVTIDCGSETCGDVSQCALLTVYEQPVIVVQPQARASCVSGMQTLCLTAELDNRTLKCPSTPGGLVPPIQLEVVWYRVSSCTAPVPDPMFPNPVCTTDCASVNAEGRLESCCTVTVDPTPGLQFYRATVRACTSGLTPTKCPVVYSDCVTVTVVDPRPCVESRVVCVGGTQCLSVNVSTLPMLPAGYNYTFRWYHLGAADCTFPSCLTCEQNPGAHGVACTGGNPVPNSAPYSGAMTSTLRIANAQLVHRGRYYVQIGLDINNDGVPEPNKCMVNSNCACLIVVEPNPMVNSATVCEGGTQYLELASPLPMLPCGYTYDYQWFFAINTPCVTNADCMAPNCPTGTALMNNARYSDVTTNRLCIMGATPAERGCYYVRVRINAPSGCTPAVLPCDRNSNCACLNVIPQPTITVHPEDAYVCLGNEQCFSVTVGYTGTAPLCWEWRRKVNCASPGSTVVSSGTWTLGQPLTFTYCVTPTPADPNDRCYFFRVRVCDPDDEDKCPPYDSDCACLTVLPPIVPCTLTCPSGQSDGSGNCLFCDRSQITLCCNVTSTAEPLCYQWYYSPTPCTPGVPGCGMPIPGATSMCFEFEFNAQNIGLPCGPGCYFVKINYLALSNPSCDSDPPGKCAPVWSNALCIAETDVCCPRECECKDNDDPNQPFYALWRTGTWDGANAEFSYDRSTTDGVVIKAADDIYLCPSSMHHIRQFLAEMLVKRENQMIEPLARLRFYTDCDGAPADLVAEFDSEPCPAFLGSTPEGFNHYQFWFDLTDDCFWLRGGVYWVSVVGIAPSQDVNYEAAWVTAGNPSGGGPRPECGMPPIGACCVGDVCTVQTQTDCQSAAGQWYRGAPCTDFTCGTSGRTLLGKRPQMMLNGDPWMEYDPCCHPCDDFVFCVSGESCPIIWDNGKPYLGGADGPAPPAPPIAVYGTRSEKSVLPVRDSRAADQFIIKPCQTPEEICYLEGYIFTNCTGFEVHLEIYRNDCDEPDFVLPGGVPFYHTTNVRVEDLGLSGLRVGTTNVRAYKVYVCDWGDNPLVLEGGQNYWISLSVRDSFSTNERAFFAHIQQPCEPCDTPNVWKVNPGMEIAPGRQIPNWRSANADFSFLIAAKKRVDVPALAGIDPERCIADANNDGQIAIDDIFYFLSAFFAGCP